MRRGEFVAQKIPHIARAFGCVDGRQRVEARVVVAQLLRFFIDELIAEIERERVYDAPVVTQVQPVPRYWPGEAYHQRYFERNPDQGYCMVVVGPKVAKFRKQFKSHLKAG